VGDGHAPGHGDDVTRPYAPRLGQAQRVLCGGGGQRGGGGAFLAGLAAREAAGFRRQGLGFNPKPPRLASQRVGAAAVPAGEGGAGRGAPAAPNTHLRGLGEERRVAVAEARGRPGRLRQHLRGEGAAPGTAGVSGRGGRLGAPRRRAAEARRAARRGPMAGAPGGPGAARAAEPVEGPGGGAGRRARLAWGAGL
jgi:hypothetical protein